MVVRRLPIVRLGKDKRGYFIDERLVELRAVDDPNDTISLFTLGSLGSAMNYARSLVDTCRSVTKEKPKDLQACLIGVKVGLEGAGYANQAEVQRYDLLDLDILEDLEGKMGPILERHKEGVREEMREEGML